MAAFPGQQAGHEWCAPMLVGGLAGLLERFAPDAFRGDFRTCRPPTNRSGAVLEGDRGGVATAGMAA